MRITVFLFFFLILNFQLFAQDYVVLKNGHTFNCKIKTITKNDIVFNDSITNDTTTYFIKKSLVFFVRYETGIKEIFSNKVSEKKDIDGKIIVKNYSHDSPIDFVYGGFYIKDKKYNFDKIKLILLDLSDREIDSLLFTAHRIKTARTAMAMANIPFGIFSLGLCISAYGYYDNLTYVPLKHPGHLVAAGAIGAIGILNIGKIIQLGIKKRRLIHMAIDIYNNKIAKL
jgi:hypothetical protein